MCKQQQKGKESQTRKSGKQTTTHKKEGKQNTTRSEKKGKVIDRRVEGKTKNNLKMHKTNEISNCWWNNRKRTISTSAVSRCLLNIQRNFH